MSDEHHSARTSSAPETWNDGRVICHDYVIVGAGPAGLQLSYFLKRAGLDHVVLERGTAPGTFFATFPRHRKLISINKVQTGIDDPELNLRWDWNSLLADNGRRFGDLTPRYFPHADHMLEYLAEYSQHHQLPIHYSFDVAEIDRDGTTGQFRITARDHRVLLCNRLIIATGVPKPWLPAFPGVEHCEIYTEVSVDPDDFTGQRVLILGKGNSAFETADNLMETTASIHLASPNPLRLAWQTHFVGHLRAVNNNILDSYHLKSQNAVLDATVQEIRREGSEYAVTLSYTHAGGEVETLRYDRVIACTGFRFDADIFAPSCRPTLKPCGRLPVMTSEWESSNIKDLFFAGTLMQYRDYKKYMSGFIHGFRYNVRALTRILEQRYHGTPWPSRAVPRTPTEIAQALLSRANQSSSLWQQPGFLCDVVQLSGGPRSAEYYEELPVDLAKESSMRQGECLMLTLEFGSIETDPFAMERIHRLDTRRASQSVFLHPVVRYYVQGSLAAEHHVIEDLAAIWNEPEHYEPLQEFLVDVLSETGLARRVDASGMAPPGTSGMYFTDKTQRDENAKTG